MWAEPNVSTVSATTEASSSTPRGASVVGNQASTSRRHDRQVGAKATSCQRRNVPPSPAVISHQARPHNVDGAHRRASSAPWSYPAATALLAESVRPSARAARAVGWSSVAARCVSAPPPTSTSNSSRPSTETEFTPTSGITTSSATSCPQTTATPGGRQRITGRQVTSGPSGRRPPAHRPDGHPPALPWPGPRETTRLQGQPIRLGPSRWRRRSGSRRLLGVRGAAPVGREPGEARPETEFGEHPIEVSHVLPARRSRETVG